jgi:hypothetical protein
VKDGPPISGAKGCNAVRHGERVSRAFGMFAHCIVLKDFNTALEDAAVIFYLFEYEFGEGISLICYCDIFICDVNLSTVI